jgi:hypothetical protein
MVIHSFQYQCCRDHVLGSERGNEAIAILTAVRRMLIRTLLLLQEPLRSSTFPLLHLIYQLGGGVEEIANRG